MKRLVFFVSDGTGITAETMGHSLLTQFDDLEFEQIAIPYVNTLSKAQEVIQRINQSYTDTQQKPLIFATLINPEIRKLFANCHGLLLDFFNAFIEPLEKELKTQSSHHIGRSHGMQNFDSYNARIAAVNFALNNDDGANTHNYPKAELILIGVSRCGKTPTCLYLALQFCVRAANYPFTQDDLHDLRLPLYLQQQRKKLFGLTIDPRRLQSIRNERRPNSHYASLEQCRIELKAIEELFQKENIPFLDTTTRSIEEISTMILAAKGLKRHLF